MANGCRIWRPQQVDSYLGCSGRGADAVRKAARDPQQTFGEVSAIDDFIPQLTAWTLTALAELRRAFAHEVRSSKLLILTT